MNQRHLLVRVMSLALLLTLCAAGVTQVAAQQPNTGPVPGLAAPLSRFQPTLQFNLSGAASAAGNDTVAVSGGGARPGIAVSIAVVPRDNILAPAGTVASVQPDAAGNFQATVQVPGNQVSGAFAVRSEQINPTTGRVLQFWWESLAPRNMGMTLQPQTTQPQITQPQSTQPQMTQPQTTQPQMTQPQPGQAPSGQGY
jgi:hypothetical protein